MKLRKKLTSESLSGAMIGVSAVLLLLAVFKTGEVVGSRKADFACRWSENYHRNFGGPKGGIFKGFGDNDFMEAHGTFGKIMQIDGNTLIVKGRDDVEKIVLAGDKTVIKKINATISLSDLKIDDPIVTIGEPNSAGQIDAKFIRLLPSLKNP